MKFIVVPKEKKDIKQYKEKGMDSFIFGLEHFSVHYPELSIEEIESLSETENLWIAVNKNIFNEELEELEKLLEKLSTYSIKGVLFYDLSILSLVRKKKLNIPLVWHQTHMVTNYNTCNYYLGKGVSYGVVANELTLDEIIEIKKNTEMKLMVQIFGYPTMAHTRRSLLTNYLKDVNATKEKDMYHLEDALGKYLASEKEAGTTFLYGKIENGMRPFFALKEAGIEYGILDTSFIETNTCLEFIDLVGKANSQKNISLEDQEDYVNQANQLIGDYTNFFYRKTIFKVKKNDKK